MVRTISGLMSTALIIALMGCTGDKGTTDRCVSGKSEPCVCSNGRSGFQTCGDDGIFTACDCSTIEDVVDTGGDDTNMADTGGVDTSTPDPQCSGIPDGVVCTVDASDSFHCIDGSCVRAFCGDGYVDDHIAEECDGAPTNTCADQGLGVGELACDECKLDTSACTSCGDGFCDIENGESQTGCVDDCAWSQLAVGNEFNCGVRKDGSFWCWGNNWKGQLAQGTTDAFDVEGHTEPLLVDNFPPDGTSITNMCAGEYMACAVLDDGSLWCWGVNEGGHLALGDGAPKNVVIPTRVTGALSGEKVLEVDCGWSWINGQVLSGPTCVSTESGTFYCAGDNRYGQLGDGTTTNANTMIEATNAANAKQLAVGSTHACALRNDGTVSCWGSAHLGQLGLGPNPTGLADCSGLSCSLTSQTVPGLSDVKHLVAGMEFVCALHNNDTLSCWGARATGQGTTRSDPVESPTLVPNISNISSLTASAYSVGVIADGVPRWWGFLPGDSNPDQTPQLVQGTVISGNMAFFGVGSEWDTTHGCVLDSEGRAYCIGKNHVGQLGDGTNDDRVTLTPIAF